jgi:hypothetical protein
MDDNVWLRCSACKKDIRYNATHWVCSVSTCNRNRTKLVFCSVVCWDSHVAILRHRDAWAVEARAPTKDAWAAELAAEEAAGGPVTRQPPVRQVTVGGAAPPAPKPVPPPAAAPRSGPAPAPAPPSAPTLSATFDKDVLIVVRRLDPCRGERRAEDRARSRRPEGPSVTDMQVAC